MRADILQDKKCVHIKLDKQVHLALRSKLFHHDISMQEVFDAFAKLLVSEDARANRILEQVIIQKVKDAIEGKPKKQKDSSINELDHSVLYDLISDKDA